MRGAPESRCSYNRRVTSETETILREALALQDAERADLAAQLIASLDPPAAGDPETIEKAWGAELERRATRVLAGDPTEDWAGVRDRVADHLKG